MCSGPTDRTKTAFSLLKSRRIQFYAVLFLFFDYLPTALYITFTPPAHGSPYHAIPRGGDVHSTDRQTREQQRAECSPAWSRGRRQRQGAVWRGRVACPASLLRLVSVEILEILEIELGRGEVDGVGVAARALRALYARGRAASSSVTHSSHTPSLVLLLLYRRPPLFEHCLGAAHTVLQA